MVTNCSSCPLRSKAAFAPMTREDVEKTERFKAGELQVAAGTQLLMEGSNAPQLYTALRGMGIRYKTLANGRRQVINFIFPGDFIGLQARLLGEMGHAVEATTPMTLCVFDRADFMEFFASSAKRGFDITWLAASEEHFLGEALASVGQRTATEAVAWALLALFQRGTSLGLVDGTSMPLPFRQQDLADALGLSLVHTNKTLSQLRKRQLAVWADGRLSVREPEALAETAGMELEDRPLRPII